MTLSFIIRTIYLSKAVGFPTDEQIIPFKYTSYFEENDGTPKINTKVTQAGLAPSNIASRCLLH